MATIYNFKIKLLKAHHPNNVNEIINELTTYLENYQDKKTGLKLENIEIKESIKNNSVKIRETFFSKIKNFFNKK